VTTPDRLANLVSHVQRLARTLGRATPGPIAVRACVALFGLAGIAAASSPEVLRSAAVAGLAVVVLMPALLPRGRWPSLAIATIVGWYLLSSSTVGHVDAWRTVAVAACVYGVHAASALAAVLPYDAVVGRRVLGPWALRAGAVILLTVAFAGFVLALPRILGDHQLLGATLGGLAVLTVAVMYLVYLGVRGYGDSARALVRRAAGAGVRRRRHSAGRPGTPPGDRQ
jgi:hypothetical protein